MSSGDPSSDRVLCCFQLHLECLVFQYFLSPYACPVRQGLGDVNGDELETQIKSLFSELEEAPKVKSAERLGKQSSSARPVKVVLRSRDAQMSIMSKKSLLKGNDKFGKVFLSPDRTVEERRERKQLVVELKEKVKQSPGTHYIIHGKRVLVAPRDN